MARSAWWRNQRGEWYVVVQFLLLGLVLLGPKYAPSLPRWPAPWALAGVLAGIGLGVLALAQIVAGFWGLGRSLTPLPHPRDDATMVEGGIYRLVRHPIYGGLILGSLGWALLLSSTLTLLYVLGLLIFFEVKARREERWLLARYPGYAAYRERTRKFIPFIY